MSGFPTAVDPDALPHPVFVGDPNEAARIGEVLRREYSLLGYDTETANPETQETTAKINEAHIVFCSLATVDERWCFDRFAAQGLEALLGDESVAKCGSGINVIDFFSTKNSGMRLEGPMFNTLVMDDLLNENNLHGLKELVWRYFKRPMPSFKDLFGNDNILKFDEDHPKFPAMVDYASRDAWEHLMVFNHLAELLDEVPLWEGRARTLLDHFLEIEAPLSRVLSHLMERGITVDTGYIADIRPGIVATLADIERTWVKMSGKAINLRSTPQLIEFFIDGLEYEPIKMTSGGASGNKKPSVDEEVLATWSGNGCEYSKLLLTHRGLTKFLGKEVDGLLKWITDDFKVHTTFKQHRAVTGRLSSADPALQNVPNAKKDKFKIRGAFCATPGCTLIVADWAQIEMRVLAALSGDGIMLDAIANGMDLHCLTVALVRGIDYEEAYAAKKAEDAGLTLTDGQKELMMDRTELKAVGFGIVYGKTAPSLAEDLGISRKEAQFLIDTYLNAYPGVKKWIKKQHQLCDVGPHFAVQTYVGRFRRLGPLPGGYSLANRVKRMAQNSPVQGTAGDMLKCAMIRAEADEILDQLECRMILTVHDELIFEVPDDEPEVVEAARLRVEEIMAEPFLGVFDYLPPLPVATPAEAKTGRTWLEAK